MLAKKGKAKKKKVARKKKGAGRAAFGLKVQIRSIPREEKGRFLGSSTSCRCSTHRGSHLGSNYKKVITLG